MATIWEAIGLVKDIGGLTVIMLLSPIDILQRLNVIGHWSWRISASKMITHDAVGGVILSMGQKRSFSSALPIVIARMFQTYGVKHLVDQGWEAVTADARLKAFTTIIDIILIWQKHISSLVIGVSLVVVCTVWINSRGIVLRIIS